MYQCIARSLNAYKALKPKIRGEFMLKKGVIVN